MSVHELERRLVLFHYFLDLLGVDKFTTLKERLRDVSEDVDELGRSHFLGALLGQKNLKLPESELVRLDARIQEYKERFRRNRSDPSFNFKYFQYLALMFTELYLERVMGGENQLKLFLKDLNDFLASWNDEQGLDLPPFKKEDLRKLAYWMATGSGKTLIMHVNYWQVMRHAKGSWDNIILLTPNEGLSQQHHEELLASGIPCQLYEGDIDAITPRTGEVLIIDIYKLTEEKKGRGVTIDINYFEGKNLVFIDEGHKGQKSEERKWKALREALGKNGFIFEYSATFGQVMGNEYDLLVEYAKSIIFDYSYKHFYLDGYGKDFFVFNLREQPSLSSDEFKYMVLTSCLLTYLDQLLAFEQHPDEMREYHVEKPLWVFVGSKVTGKKLNSDVMHVLRYLKIILQDPTILTQWITKILSGDAGLVDVNGNDIFADKLAQAREFLQQRNLDDISRLVFQKIFHGTGHLEIHELKRCEGELALKTSDSPQYFGVGNVGNVSSLKKLITLEGIPLKEDYLSSSLFSSLNDSNSPINMLIGSKKFVEGWNSWRVSTMGLLNIGKGEGPQIIQLFGRGVRLKGKNHSLKRESNVATWLKVVQTLFVFGLNADYINTFLEKLAAEEVTYLEFSVPLRLNHPNSWENAIHVVTRRLRKKREKIDPFLLEYDPEVAEGLMLDFRPVITATRGFSLEELEHSSDETLTEIPSEILEVLDWERLYLELLEFKREKGLHEVIITKIDVLRDILEGRYYHVKVPASLRELRSFKDLDHWQKIASSILKGYVSKYYQERVQRYQQWQVHVERVTSRFNGIFPRSGNMLLRVPLSDARMVRQLKKAIRNPRSWDGSSSPLLHVEHHLYSPLIFPLEIHQGLVSSPKELNSVEVRFVQDMVHFLRTRGQQILGNHEVFFARVLPGSQLQKNLDDAFSPNFIVWVREREANGHEHVVYLDFNGSSLWRGFNDEKITFCNVTIKEMEKEVQNIVLSTYDKDDNGDKLKIHCHAFILSEIPFERVRQSFADGMATLDKFHLHHVLFLEENSPHYLETLFTTVIRGDGKE